MKRNINRLRQIVLRKIFNILYHQFAFGYDFVSFLVSLGLWKTWIHSALKYLSGPNILEIGHGPGHLYTTLCMRGFRVAGLDESWYMVRLAKKNLSRSDLEIKTVQGHAQYLPYKSNHFNQIVATFPSNYIIEPDTLNEIRRVLAPTGSLIVIPLAWITGKIWIQRLAAGLFRISGQTPDKHINIERKWIEVFTNAEFQVKYEYIDLGSSVVLIVIASKSQP